MGVLQFIIDHGIDLAFTVAVAVVIIKLAWDFVS